jgi:hypothetical protein
MAPRRAAPTPPTIAGCPSAEEPYGTVAMFEDPDGNL